MSGLLLAVGVVLLIIVSSDVLITTLTMQGGGFITDRFSSWLWCNAIKIHEHSSNHRLLVRTGLILLSGIVALDEAMTVLQYAIPSEVRPDAASLNPARRACASFLKTLKSAYLKYSDRDPPLVPLEILRKHGLILISDRCFQKQISHTIKRRRLLLALVENDGWAWNAIASSETTSTS